MALAGTLGGLKPGPHTEEPGLSASTHGSGGRAGGWAGGDRSKRVTVTPNVTTQAFGGQEFPFQLGGRLSDQCTVHHTPARWSGPHCWALTGCTL